MDKKPRAVVNRGRLLGGYAVIGQMRAIGREVVDLEAEVLRAGARVGIVIDEEMDLVPIRTGFEPDQPGTIERRGRHDLLHTERLAEESASGGLPALRHGNTGVLQAKYRR